VKAAEAYEQAFKKDASSIPHARRLGPNPIGTSATPKQPKPGTPWLLPHRKPHQWTCTAIPSCSAFQDNMPMPTCG
jgi:hypothetical protein